MYLMRYRNGSNATFVRSQKKSELREIMRCGCDNFAVFAPCKIVLIGSLPAAGQRSRFLSA